MSIIYYKEECLFHLSTKESSYIIKIVDKRYALHLYYGRKIRNVNLEFINKYLDIKAPFIQTKNSIHNFSLNMVPQEYPWYGNGDLRSPAFEVEFDQGVSLCELEYTGYKIYKGKNKIRGLPCTYSNNTDECDTLQIEFFDKIIGIRVCLLYSVFNNKEVISRNVIFENQGIKDIKINKALSMSLDFANENFNVLYLKGAYARESNLQKHKIHKGLQCIDSKGGRSDHQQTPFLAITKEHTSEFQGEAYGFTLAYSGNFIASVEMNEYDNVRLQLGINPFNFSWNLKTGETFYTPEVIMTYSYKGLNYMSNTFHKLFKHNLIRGEFKHRKMPVVMNNWETTYFDFHQEQLEKTCKDAKEIGIELFLLDDGWFGKRDDDKSSLGDWYVNRKKFPKGLKSFVDYLLSIDMEFGIWFEPEMVSQHSELYRRHPEWCIQVEERVLSKGRNQYVLDLCNIEVCNEIIEILSKFLYSYNISYVKWDMNRYMTEIGSLFLRKSNQKETSHRYILGLYYILEKITKSFPKVYFESCASGGGRCDAGMLYYMPYIYISSDNDSIERIKSQYGASLLYPPSSMCTHISPVPNRHTNRFIPMETRCILATSSVLGVDMNLQSMDTQEREILRQYIDFYKKNRQLICHGNFYRLISPFTNNEAAWMFVSENKEEAILYYFRFLNIPNYVTKNLKLYGLREDFDYKVEKFNVVMGGDELMYCGLNLEKTYEDFKGYYCKLIKC